MNEDESFEEMAASYSFCSQCMNAMDMTCIEGEDCECECHNENSRYDNSTGF